MIMLKVVVLPAPFGPMIPTISHSPMKMLTSEAAFTPPNRIEQPRVSSTDVRHLHFLQTPVVDVEAVSGVRLGPGTLYATLARLEARGLIEAMPATERRRPYRITGAGLELVRERLERMEMIARAGLGRLARV